MPQTARFVSKLVGNIERNYQTATDMESLLSSKNISTIGNHTHEGVGNYVDLFEDDMAITRTVVTMDVDGDGRPFYNLDVAIAKFDGRDKPLILDLLKQAFLGKLAEAQNNGELTRPLASIQF